MQIFLAGPDFSISARQLSFEAGAASPVSSQRPSRDDSEPDRDEANGNTQDHVQKREKKLAVPEALKRFQLERRKGRIGADESDRDQIAPIRVPMRSFREQGHDKSDQERSGNINDECAVRKARSHSIADIPSQ